MSTPAPSATPPTTAEVPTPQQRERATTIFERSVEGRRAGSVPATDVPERPLDELIPANLRREVRDLENDDVYDTIFDSFRDESGRQNHLNGPIAKALMAQAPHLLAAAPVIEPMDVLGVKLP